MGAPAILCENIFSTLCFPGHSLATNDANGVGAAGYEVYHIRDGRRAPNDRYQADTPNVGRLITATCDRVRFASGLCIDRVSNLAGVGGLAVLGSSDGWTSQFTLWTGTIPTAMTPGGSLDDPNGVVTEEGAFLVRFSADGALAFRLSIPALGSGITAQVVGAWLGTWLSLPFLGKPWTDDAGDIQGTETQSSSGWMGSTVPVHRGQGVLNLDTTSLWDEDFLRLDIDGHYLAARRPMWYVPDDAQAERGMLLWRPKGIAGLGYEPGAWGFRSGRIPYLEHEPLRSGG